MVAGAVVLAYLRGLGVDLDLHDSGVSAGPPEALTLETREAILAAKPALRCALVAELAESIFGPVEVETLSRDEGQARWDALEGHPW